MLELKKEAAKLLTEATGIAVKEQELSPTPKPELGFFASNIAFRLGGNPVEKAKELAPKLTSETLEARALGPYINFFPKKGYSKQLVTQILKEKSAYGAGSKKKDKVMIEFSQPNTHKAFHVGHIRSTAFGAALANIIEHYGYSVVRANYQGDVGAHISKCLWALQKFHAGEKPPITGRGLWLANIYQEACDKLAQNLDYEEEVKQVFHKLYFDHEPTLTKLWQETRQWSIDEFNEIYADWGVKFDIDFFESQVEKEGVLIVKDLVKKGIAKVDDGAIIIELGEKLGNYLLLRSDGTPLYSTKDLALAAKKFNEYKIDRSIYVTAAEQKLHFEQLFETLKRMGFPQAEKCVHIPFELVLGADGKKMKTRQGTAVFYEAFADEAIERAMKEIETKNPDLPDKVAVAKAIGIGAIRYAMLKVSNNKTISFDWDKAMAFEGETAPYIQYANVRCHSILSKTEAKPKVDAVDAVELIYQLSRFDEVVAESAERYSPHLLAAYAHALAEAFSRFYTNTKVLGSDDEPALLALVQATSFVLEDSLRLLGIEAPEKM